jgi:hypothetical protein
MALLSYAKVPSSTLGWDINFFLLFQQPWMRLMNLAEATSEVTAEGSASRLGKGLHPVSHYWIIWNNCIPEDAASATAAGDQSDDS